MCHDELGEVAHLLAKPYRRAVMSDRQLEFALFAVEAAERALRVRQLARVASASRQGQPTAAPLDRVLVKPLAKQGHALRDCDLRGQQRIPSRERAKGRFQPFERPIVV